MCAEDAVAPAQMPALSGSDDEIPPSDDDIAPGHMPAGCALGGGNAGASSPARSTPEIEGSKESGGESGIFGGGSSGGGGSYSQGGQGGVPILQAQQPTRPQQLSSASAPASTGLQPPTTASGSGMGGSSISSSGGGGGCGGSDGNVSRAGREQEGEQVSYIDARGHAKCADDPSPSTTQLQSMTSSPATNGAAVESRDGEMAGDDGEEEEDVQRRSGSLPPSGDDEAGQGEKAGGETAFVILSPRGFEFTGDERRVDFNGKQIPAQELMLRVKEIEPWLQDEVLVLLEQDSSEPRESFSSGETVIVERGSSEQLQRVNASHGIDGQRVSSNRHVVDAAGALTNSGNGLSEDRVVPAPQQCQDGNDVGRIEGAEGEGERERAVQANPSNPVRVFTIFVNLDLVCLSNINQS